MSGNIAQGVGEYISMAVSVRNHYAGAMESFLRSLQQLACNAPSQCAHSSMVTEAKQEDSTSGAVLQD